MGFFSAVKKFFGSENEAPKSDADQTPSGRENIPPAGEREECVADIDLQDAEASSPVLEEDSAEEKPLNADSGEAESDEKNEEPTNTAPLSPSEKALEQFPAESSSEDPAPLASAASAVPAMGMPNWDNSGMAAPQEPMAAPITENAEPESTSQTELCPATDAAAEIQPPQSQVNLAATPASPFERSGFVLPKRFQRQAKDEANAVPETSEAAVLREAPFPGSGETSSSDTKAARLTASTAASRQYAGSSRGQAAGVSPASAQSVEDAELIKRLREAEPRLSQWLNIVLEGQEEVGEVFWHRIRFLLRSLEAPESETEEFVTDFAQWLKRMDYVYVDEFRSELQYRLALALDLEDEEDERNRLLLRLSQGLAATREKLGMGLNVLFSGHGQLDNAFWEELEELFIMADLGYATSVEIVARLKRRAARENVTAVGDVRGLLQDELEEIFKQEPRIRAVNKPEVVLMMGVNGAGKTTTIAKLAHREKMSGKKVLIVAADTFRAAAIEQLQVWAERVGVDFFARPEGSDPASVAWAAMDYAREHNDDVIFVDTAGRLQTRVNLMEELGKIRQVLAKKHPGAPHRNVLVLDATTGQNALSQAKLFREAAGADELILTKLDGTAKGGVAIAVAMQEHLPITYIGLGEKMDDLRPFHGSDFAKALLRDLAEEQSPPRH